MSDSDNTIGCGALKALAIILTVSLASSALLAAIIWAYNPDYLRDASACRIPDAGAYLRLGHNLLYHGQCSRSAEAPLCYAKLLSLRRLSRQRGAIATSTSEIQMVVR